jgi:hypothetical protein
MLRRLLRVVSFSSLPHPKNSILALSGPRRLTYNLDFAVRKTVAKKLTKTTPFLQRGGLLLKKDTRYTRRGVGWRVGARQ